MKGRRQAQAGGAAEAGIMWSAGSRWPIRMQTVADRLLTRCLSAEIGSRPTEVDNRWILRVEATACGAWAARRLRAAWRRASSRRGASLSASSHPSPTTPPTPAAHCLRGGACLHEGLTARRASPLLSGHLNKIFLPVTRPGFERSHTLARARSVAFVVAIVPR